jgi:signal transduction histidine kinase
MTKREHAKRADSVAAGTELGGSTKAAHDNERLVHELQVHQLELEMQNEELRTARLEAERAREQYQELFRAAPAGYVTVDAAGLVANCNAAAAGMLRRPAQQLLRERFEGFVARSDRVRLTLHLESARSHKRADCELRVELPNGTALLVRFDTSPIPSCDGACLLVLTDMSERQRDQELLERVNRELETRVSERTLALEAQNRTLQAEMEARARAEEQHRELQARMREAERLQSLGMLAAGVAHDFNNLLVGVVGNAEVLLRTPGIREAWRESLGMIRRTGQEASELTRQLLEFAGQGRMEKSALDLSELISDCVELLRPRFGSAVRIEQHVEDAVQPISADRSQLQRVLINLLTNAVEAMGGRGVLEVGLRVERLDTAALAEFQHSESAQPGAFEVFYVADTGRGIDHASVTRIFEPFFSTKFTGRGLGLATVLGIVQSHCGAIRVSSQPGRGTRFEIALPRNSEGVKAQPSAARCAPAGVEWSASGSVLVIDDDDQVGRVVAQLLAEMGLEVTVAQGGESGLALVDRDAGHFKLVVLDWLMPSMSGEVVLRELRRRDPTLPVILMSGYSADRLSYSDDYVTCIQKPMTFDQLEAAVRGALTPVGRAVC